MLPRKKGKMSEKLSSTPEKNINRVPWKVRAFAATSLALAGVGAVDCGDGEGDKSAVLGAEVTAEPSLTATIEITVEPTAKAVETPTPKAEVIKPISDVAAIKAGLTEVYMGKTVPNGSCNIDTINAYADQIEALYKKNPNKFTLAGQIATIYAELTVIAKSQDDAAVSELAKGLKAGVEVLIVEHLQEKGLPASNKAELVAAWEQNVARKVNAIKDVSGCDIVLEKAK